MNEVQQVQALAADLDDLEAWAERHEAILRGCMAQQPEIKK